MEVDMQRAEALEHYIEQGLPNGLDTQPPERAVVDLLKGVVDAVPSEAGFKEKLYQDILQGSAPKKVAPEPRKTKHILDWIREPRIIGAAALIILLLVLFAYPGFFPIQTNNLIRVTPSDKVTQALQEKIEPIKPLLPLFGVSSVKAAQQGGQENQKPEYVLEANFPTSPADVQVYERKPDELLTTENARAAAQRLGIQGDVYYTDNQNPQNDLLTVIDTDAKVTFSGSTRNFTYESFQSKTSLDYRKKPLTSDERIRIAEQFLEKSGYLDFPYIISANQIDNKILTIQPLYDGHPLVEGANISLEISSEGRIVYFNYQYIDVQAVGGYPIRTAEEAWKIVSENRYDGRMQQKFSFYKPPQYPAGDTAQEWHRSYTPGNRGDLYGNPFLLKPVDPQDSPWISINDIPLEGELQGISEELLTSTMNVGAAVNGTVESDSSVVALPPVALYHVWGVFQPGKTENGLTFQVEGWRKIPQSVQTISGNVVKKDGKAWLVDENGNQFWLPDLPGDVLEGKTYDVEGVILVDPATVEWNKISLAPISGGGGGGGGGGDFGNLEFNPNGDADQSPVVTPTPLPWKSGDRLDDVVGELTVTATRDKSGLVTYTDSTCLKFTPSEDEDLCLQVKGAGKKDIEQFNHLHVRFWGTFDTVDGQPAIIVERYEKAYPSEKIEAWLGIIRNQKVNGRLVQVFYDMQGSKYVLESSIFMPETIVQQDVWGDIRVVIEGILLDGKTYGDYSIIRELSRAMDPQRTELKDYVIKSGEPFIIDETQFQDPWKGKITIDNIQLSYYTEDVSITSPDWTQSRRLYVQPVWLFSGKSEAGGSVEIIIQAVVDKYLTVQ